METKHRAQNPPARTRQLIPRARTARPCDAADRAREVVALEALHVRDVKRVDEDPLRPKRASEPASD